LKSRQDDIKQGVRFGIRQIRSTTTDGDDQEAAMVERLRIIKSAVEFVVRDVTAKELSVAIVETFKDLHSECDIIEPIARFCEERLATDSGS
jgi:hypothetical protein